MYHNICFNALCHIVQPLGSTAVIKGRHQHLVTNLRALSVITGGWFYCVLMLSFSSNLVERLTTGLHSSDTECQPISSRDYSSCGAEVSTLEDQYLETELILGHVTAVFPDDSHDKQQVATTATSCGGSGGAGEVRNSGSQGSSTSSYFLLASRCSSRRGRLQPTAPHCVCQPLSGNSPPSLLSQNQLASDHRVAPPLASSGWFKLIEEWHVDAAT